MKFKDYFNKIQKNVCIKKYLYTVFELYTVDMWITYVNFNLFLIILINTGFKNIYKLN